MKHIEQTFSLNAWVQSPGWTSGVGPMPFFSEYGHVAYQIKADDECSNI